MSYDDSELLAKGVGTGIAAIISGVTLFYKGFKKYELAKRMQDIPTSKIATAAIGENVELKTFVSKLNFGIDCFLSPNRAGALIITLEVKSDSRNNRSWDKICTIYSSPYLLIEDKSSGLAALSISNMEFLGKVPSKKIRFTSNRYSKLNPKLQRILKNKKIINFDVGLFSSRAYQITESYIPLNQELYLFGNAREYSEKHFQNEIKFEGRGKNYFLNESKLVSSVDDLVEDFLSEKDNIAEADLNNDGYIQENERFKIKEKLLKEINNDGYFDLKDFKDIKLILCKSKGMDSLATTGKVKISFDKEDKVVRNEKLKAFIMIIASPIIVLIGIGLVMFGLSTLFFENT